MYAYACGVERNDAEAAKWFRRSADMGAAGSMFHLGRMYLAGRGVPKDVAEATRLWKKSSELGYARAQYFYALVTRPGDGVKKAEISEADMDKWLSGYVNNDFPRALAAVRPVAARGDAWAQAFLGSMLEKGEGTTRDEAEGLKWNTLAADQGYSLSQSELAAKYANGQGVPQSNVQAYKWASLAAAQNDEAAKKLEASLSGKMTPAELAEARKLVAEWKPKH
jgi:TPR repeat protein